MHEEPSAGIARVPVLFVNAYLVDVTPGVRADGWVLVDSGLRGLGAAVIQKAASDRYGAGTPPRAIVLTHGHFDHAGSAATLAQRWDCPVFAHRLELPYLTAQSDYPPQDPTVGGALAAMSRVFPHSACDLRPYVQPLPGDGTVPFLPGWRAIHTEGHTPGHVSLWRQAGGVLLAGDAVATMNQESWTRTVTMPCELRWPPIPMTTDWKAAHASVRALAELRPQIIAAGHGLPMSGEGLPEAFDAFARTFRPPSHGRYVRQPARADADGVIAIPPPVPDPVGMTLWAIAGSAALFTILMAVRARHRD
ncbi:MAG: MBL fold metallo-hydrolase [Acidobacteriota bacterium]|nr:MBL fold metallo-hydrolase [Acidobacteriota bacterium]